MKRLIIKNFGPIGEACMDFGRINIIIGPQSSGKSCILKTGCYCSWVEKRIEINQSADLFGNGIYFLTRLLDFHRLHGYEQENTYISYETDYMYFAYNHNSRQFEFRWKTGRWQYRRPKISYIPSERNLVAAIPNWYEVKFADDNIRNFMADWETARKAAGQKEGILNLNVSYQYDSQEKTDKIIISDNKSLDFSDTSSGLQSLIPIVIHLDYLYSNLSGNEKQESVAMGDDIKRLSDTILKENFTADELKLDSEEPAIRHLYNMFFFLKNDDIADRFTRILNHYIETDHNEIFLEEPEDNLFPPTQTALSSWLLDKTLGNDRNCLFIATHSPYIMTSFTESQSGEDFRLFFTIEHDRKSSIRTATESELQEIYDNGIDVFFNIEAFKDRI